MAAFKDLTGKRFGRITVFGFAHWHKGTSYWFCDCDCGRKLVVRGADLTNGHTKSCGCYHISEMIERNTTHGMTGHPLLNIWRHMVQRTTNPKDEAYPLYGGRGIKMYKPWLKSSSSFIKWALSNGYRRGLTIDRINNNKGYNPRNCRWVNMKVQSRNRRNNHYIMFGGHFFCIAEWAELLGISQYTISRRLRLGWTAEKALTTPVRRTKACG